MKVCFIGTGSIGKRHIRNLTALSQQKNFNLKIHLLRKTNRKLDDDIQKHVDKIMSDIEELDAFYDAIFITNPTHMHYATLMSVYRLSNTFFIEKPVFDQLYLDISIVNENKEKIFYVACPLRYTKVVIKAKMILKKEKIYSVRAISSSYLPDWRPKTDYKDSYSAHKDQGGGVRLDLIHEWDYLTYLFGMPQKCISTSGTFSELQIDSEDLAAYIGVYTDKLVELHLDYIGRETRRNFEVITSEHVYIFDIAGSLVKMDGKVIEKYDELANDKYMEEMCYFCSLVNREVKNSNTVQHALDVVKLAVE